MLFSIINLLLPDNKRHLGSFYRIINGDKIKVRVSQMGSHFSRLYFPSTASGNPRLQSPDLPDMLRLPGNRLTAQAEWQTGKSKRAGAIADGGQGTRDLHVENVTS